VVSSLALHRHALKTVGVGCQPRIIFSTVLAACSLGSRLGTLPYRTIGAKDESALVASDRPPVTCRKLGHLLRHLGTVDIFKGFGPANQIEPLVHEKIDAANSDTLFDCLCQLLDLARDHRNNIEWKKRFARGSKEAGRIA